MDFKKDLLLRCGARLYSLGVDLEGKRGEIQRLVEEGVDYSSSEMLRALSEYIELKHQWEALEQDYLKLRKEILK